METLRVFIALELSSEIHQQLRQIQDELKKSGADVKWVNPEGIHLTLKFLGNVSLEMTEEIKKTIEKLAKAERCFELTITGISAFPKIEYPRVIWVGIKQGKEQACRLAQDLEEGLINLGFLREKRPFEPHLTLGRVRSAHQRSQLVKLLQTLNSPEKTIQIKNVILFKSTLTPQGAIYQPLYQSRLIPKSN